MPARKTKITKKEALEVSKGLKFPGPPRFALPKIKDVLATIFYLVWIPIGVFLLFFIVMSFRQGAFNSVLGKSPTANTSQTQQQPTETQISGVGTVNIACVQSNLSQEAIQKIVTIGDTSTFTAEEKTKLEPCITQKEQPAAQEAPKQ